MKYPRIGKQFWIKPPTVLTSKRVSCITIKNYEVQMAPSSTAVKLKIMCKHLPTTGDIFKKNVTGYRQMLEKCQCFKANA